MTEVLVVDDSQFMRTVLATTLAEHGYDVRTASDGETAVEAAIEHDPDVITMDVQMPGIGGIEAVERIVARNPTPIVMLSAYTRDGADATLDAMARGAIDFVTKPGGEISPDVNALEADLVETIEAVTDADVDTVAWERAAAAAQSAADAEATVRAASAAVAQRATDGAAADAADDESPDGAAAVSAGTEAAGSDVEAPADAEADVVPDTATAIDASFGATGSERDPAGTESAVDARTDATRPVSADGFGGTRLGATDGDARALGELPTPSVSVPADLDQAPTVVIGASTGGPRVVERVLATLPLELDARVLVVQHMPSSFTDRLARRIDGVSDYDVREAADGARLADSDVLVAKGGYHMAVTYSGEEHGRVRLTEDEPEHGVRPAIDVTMRTAATEVDRPLVGVALTGMGRDGAEGVSAIKAAGGATIAQDQASAPVFGIPGHAVKTGDVDRVLSANRIAGGIVDAAVELDGTDEVSDDD